MLTLATLASVSKTLGHGGRLRILAMLRDGPLSVCQIAAVLAAPVSTVSGYLLELRQAGLVVERRQGRWIFYRLSDADARGALVATLLASMDSDPLIREDAAAAARRRQEPPSVLCKASDAATHGTCP